MSSKKIPVFFLRFGLAFVFLYAGAMAFLHPLDWIGFLPHWLKGIVPLSDQNLLSVFSFAQLFLGVMLLLGIQVFFVSVLSSLMLLGIVAFNWGALDILFRDVGLFFAALALVFLSR